MQKIINKVSYKWNYLLMLIDTTNKVQDPFKKLRKQLNIFLTPFVFIRKLIYKTAIEKVLDYEGDDLAGYLIEGTQFKKEEIQKVINRLKRDEGYKSESAAAELTYQIRTKALFIAQYAFKNKLELAMSYHIVKNNGLCHK